MRKFFKSTALELLANPWIGRFLTSTGRPRCAVLMLHRFRTPEGTHVGHDPKKLRTVLEGLRRAKVGLVNVEDAIDSMDSEHAAPTDNVLSVAFTVDDGYADVVDIAAPIFAEFDCPVTTFVVPDVIEGRCWFWWDQIDWILRRADSKDLALELQHQSINLSWHDAASLFAVQKRIGEQLKRVDHAVLRQFIDQLSARADVPLPAQAPDEYRVLSWSEIRAAEQKGMQFGAHSMSHPVLSRCDNVQAVAEIVDSVNAVKTHVTKPASVFCYPFGKQSDYGPREAEAVKAAGLSAAISSEHALIRRRETPSTDRAWRYTVPRFAYDERTGGISRLFLGWQ